MCDEFDLTPFERPSVKVPFLENGEIEIMDILIKSQVELSRLGIKERGYKSSDFMFYRTMVLLSAAGWAWKPTRCKYSATAFGKKEFEKWREDNDN